MKLMQASVFMILAGLSVAQIPDMEKAKAAPRMVAGGTVWTPTSSLAT
jgi:hypothetical protein